MSLLLALMTGPIKNIASPHFSTRAGDVKTRKKSCWYDVRLIWNVSKEERGTKLVKKHTWLWNPNAFEPLGFHVSSQEDMPSYENEVVLFFFRHVRIKCMLTWHAISSTFPPQPFLLIRISIATGFVINPFTAPGCCHVACARWRWVSSKIKKKKKRPRKTTVPFFHYPPRRREQHFKIRNFEESGSLKRCTPPTV